MRIHDETKKMPGFLKSDCAKCSGLCCTALFFSKLDGFPQDKKAGRPCVNLQEDYRCKIHSELKTRGMRGCIGYDCFGAGQQVTNVTYRGKTWQTSPAAAEEIFEIFLKMFGLHQIRSFLEEACILIPAMELREQIEIMIYENEVMRGMPPQELLAFNLDEYRDRVNSILKQVCTLVEEFGGRRGKDCPADFLGKTFARRDMDGLDLSMRLLIAANFSGCRFDGTVFLGADTRDSDFGDSDLREAVFLSQGQVNAAKGNKMTKIPPHLDYPVTWQQGD